MIALIVLIWVAVLVVLIMMRRIYDLLRLVVWYSKHTEELRPVFEQAFIIRSVPDHSNVLTVGTGTHKAIKPELNYETLKEVTLLMLEMEEERRTAVMRMGKSLDALAVWETENRAPELKSPLRLPWR